MRGQYYVKVTPIEETGAGKTVRATQKFSSAFLDKGLLFQSNNDVTISRFCTFKRCMQLYMVLNRKKNGGIIKLKGGARDNGRSKEAP